MNPTSPIDPFDRADQRLFKVDGYISQEDTSTEELAHEEYSDLEFSEEEIDNAVIEDISNNSGDPALIRVEEKISEAAAKVDRTIQLPLGDCLSTLEQTTLRNNILAVSQLFSKSRDAIIQSARLFSQAIQSAAMNRILRGVDWYIHGYPRIITATLLGYLAWNNSHFLSSTIGNSLNCLNSAVTIFSEGASFGANHSFGPVVLATIAVGTTVYSVAIIAERWFRAMATYNAGKKDPIAFQDILLRQEIFKSQIAKSNNGNFSFFLDKLRK